MLQGKFEIDPPWEWKGKLLSHLPFPIKMYLQIKTLQEQVTTLRRADVDPPQTITADLEELRRE